MGTKITSMSAGAIDPIAQTKRVFWRPATPGTPLKTGDPVCYKLDANDQKERTTTPVPGHIGGVGTTYAEGAQTYTGRLFNVEEPLLDNIDQFAGIVKSLGPKAGADGDMIEIFKANSGAVVPCNLVGSLTTIVGRTILSVMVGTRTLGSPTKDMPSYGYAVNSVDSKVVGIAMELRTTTGKCWVKLDENMFIHQGGSIANPFVVAAGAVNVDVNSANVEFKTTAESCLLHMRAKLSGAGFAKTGVYRFDVKIAVDQSNTVYGHEVYLEIAATQTHGGCLAVTRVLLRSRGVNPTLDTLNYICATQYEWSMTQGAAGSTAMNNNCPLRPWLRFLADGSLPTHLLYVNSIAELGGHVSAGDAPAWAAGDVMIPIKIGGNDFYLIGYADSAAA